MALDSVQGAFFADPAALSGLKREAGAQSPEAIRETAKQFESLFTTMMLKSMRSASMGEDMFGSGQTEFYQEMFDQQLAVQLSKGKGLGLADMLVRQLMTGTDGTAPAVPAPSPDVGLGQGGGRASGPFACKEDFIAAIRPACTAAAKELGVDPDTVIAHAALETGWGRHLPTGSDGRPSLQPLRHQGRQQVEGRGDQLGDPRIPRRQHAAGGGAVPRLCHPRAIHPRLRGPAQGQPALRRGAGHGR